MNEAVSDHFDCFARPIHPLQKSLGAHKFSKPCKDEVELWFSGLHVGEHTRRSFFLLYLHVAAICLFSSPLWTRLLAAIESSNQLTWLAGPHYTLLIFERGALWLFCEPLWPTATHNILLSIGLQRHLRVSSKKHNSLMVLVLRCTFFISLKQNT